VYDWLIDETAKVRTRKFFMFDGPAPPSLHQVIEESLLPPSYKAFVIRFGGAKLFRQGGVYLVRVLASPIEAEGIDGEKLVHFGRTDVSMAYFMYSMLDGHTESPVFCWTHGRKLSKSAMSFEDWLERVFKASKKRFSGRAWQQIERGPAAFSASELAVVEARRRFRWRVVGIAANGDLQFEVHNGSQLILPYLSIGVRGTPRIGHHEPLDGGVWLPVSSILPGETRVVEKDCYKNIADPKDVVAFEKEPPEPEDRERYWEFKSLG
jgi:hypothetical protein